MNGNLGNHGPTGPFSLFANPFHVLGVEPGATIQQVREAFDAALESRSIETAALASARDVVLDPQRRLPHELGCLIDSRPAGIEALYVALAGDTSLEDRLDFASAVPPLSRANFLGHLAAHQPASSALLSALLDAHASIEASEIFVILKGVRASAGLSAPSLVNVGQGLVELAERHAQAAIAQYGSVQEAADPILASTQETLSQGRRHHIEALEPFLGAYRRIALLQQSAATEGIEKASEALLRESADAQSLEDLKAALLAWLSICRPLVLWGLHQHASDPELELPVDQLRGVIVNLTGRECYDVALNLAEFGRDVFGIRPGAADQFAGDLGLIAELLSEAKAPPASDGHTPSDSRGPRLGRVRLARRLSGLAVVTLLSAAGIYFGFRIHWSPPSSTPAISEASFAEIMPPVGAGQRLELGGVRYCKFQEARLLLMKPDVRGAEDTRTFNKLAEDYNSRCSDFFYRDSDLNAVKAEMAQNSLRFAADAKRIMSTWPGHVSAVPPAK